MKQVIKILSLFAIVLLVGCGGKEEKKENSVQIGGGEKTEVKKEAATENAEPASKRVDLVNKGIGPIKSIELGESIDQAMATKGEAVFKANCTACHKADKKFIGPAPTGILERRTPEWVMNMILNPEEMTKNDPLAHDLLIEFNGSPMANQHLSEEESRQILEYFRTL